jgi:tetratricopeptide (TPR) repeat protein
VDREPVEVPVDLTAADSTAVLFYLAGQTPVSLGDLAEKCQQNQTQVRDILNRRFQNEVQIDQTGFVRLIDAARNDILTEVNPIVTEATERQKHGQAASNADNYEKASEQYRVAAKLFSLAEERLSTVGDVPDKLTERAESVREKHDHIQQEIAKDTLSHRKILAEQREEAGDEAVQSEKYDDAVQAYQSAMDAFEEAKEAIEAYNERRLSSESDSLDSGELNRLLDALKRKRRNANDQTTETDHSAASKSETQATDKDRLSTSSNTLSDTNATVTNGDTQAAESRQTLLDELQEVADTVGIPPSIGEVDEHGTIESAVYLDEFGTWADALASAGLRTTKSGSDPTDRGDAVAVDPESDSDDETTTEAETGTRPPTRDNVIEEIRRKRDDHGRMPKMSEVVETSPWNRRTIWANFDSWDEAIEAAGIDKREELTDLMNEVIERLGREPTRSEMDKYGVFSSGTYYSEFGSWEKALAAANETSAPVDDAETGSEERPTNFAAFDDMTPNKRFSDGLAIKLDETAYAGSKRDAVFDISDHTGETIRFNFWSKHDLDYPTETGVWYVVNEVRLQQWESDGEMKRNLSSTRDTTHRRLDNKQQVESTTEEMQQATEKGTEDTESRNTTDQQGTSNTESSDSASAASDTTDDTDTGAMANSLLDSIEEEFDDDIV